MLGCLRFGKYFLHSTQPIQTHLVHVQTNTAFSSVDNSFQVPITVIPTTTEILIMPPLPLHKEKSRTPTQTFDLETLVCPGKGHTITDG